MQRAGSKDQDHFRRRTVVVFLDVSCLAKFEFSSGLHAHTLFVPLVSILQLLWLLISESLEVYLGTYSCPHFDSARLSLDRHHEARTTAGLAIKDHKFSWPYE